MLVYQLLRFMIIRKILVRYLLEEHNLHEDKKAIRRLMDMLIARDKAYRMHERQKEYNYRSYMGCKLCKQFFQKKRIKRLMTRKSKQINRK